LDDLVLGISDVGSILVFFIYTVFRCFDKVRYSKGVELIHSILQEDK